MEKCPKYLNFSENIFHAHGAMFVTQFNNTAEDKKRVWSVLETIITIVERKLAGMAIKITGKVSFTLGVQALSS